MNHLERFEAHRASIRELLDKMDCADDIDIIENELFDLREQAAARARVVRALQGIED